MILYNVKRRFFNMKGEAEPYRKAEGLPPTALNKLNIKNAEHLAEFLNELCDSDKFPDLSMEPEEEVSAAIQVDQEVIPDCVPEFIKKSWGH